MTQVISTYLALKRSFNNSVRIWSCVKWTFSKVGFEPLKIRHSWEIDHRCFSFLGHFLDIIWTRKHWYSCSIVLEKFQKFQLNYCLHTRILKYVAQDVWIDFELKFQPSELKLTIESNETECPIEAGLQIWDCPDDQGSHGWSCIDRKSVV